MSLYLGVFDGDDEVEGWVLGRYSDFGYFRETIANKIPNASERFPALMQHSDCEGNWSGDELSQLKSELVAIATSFRKLPPEEPREAFVHAAEARQAAASLYECFHNVDDENLFDALAQLCDTAAGLGLPIVMQ